MTVYALPWGPKPQFVDANGAPMSSGTLSSFIATSTTPQVTYTDSSGGVANSTTMTLNTRGETPNEVWLTGGVSYKFVLKDSAGSTVWTVDNVSGVNDTSASFSEWVTGPAPTFVGTTSFTLAGDQTTTFTVGRRIRTTNSGGTIYSTITASAFVASTTVTVVNDSGVLDSGLSAVSYGLLSSANSSVPSVKFSSGNWSLAASFTATKDLNFSGTVSPSQITSNQNDYNPTSLSSASTLRLNTDASRNITGLAGGADGRIITIVNVGSTPIVLTNQDALSTAANRFLLKADTTLALDQAITLRYDNTTARWRPFTGGVTKQPTRQVFTTGTAATYTTPTGATRINVRMVGGGGGGAGSGTGPGAAAAGTASTWSGGTLSAGGGGAGGAANGAVGAGGTSSNGDVNLTGGDGGSQQNVANTAGNSGGMSVFGGGGPASYSAAIAGNNAKANTGGGGGGAGCGATVGPGGGGGAGGYVEKLITAPSATYTYTVGASGAGGTLGAAGGAGGSGAVGIIIVDEFYD